MEEYVERGSVCDGGANERDELFRGKKCRVLQGNNRRGSRVEELQSSSESRRYTLEEEAKEEGSEGVKLPTTYEGTRMKLLPFELSSLY